MLRPGIAREGAFHEGRSPVAVDRAMAGKPRSSARLRSTLDRVLVHDVKNVSFRLRLLLSNLDEHWEDPDFRRTVQDLLASTVERLEGRGRAPRGAARTRS